MFIVKMLPLYSVGCILRSTQSTKFGYFRPKALSCLHEVSDVQNNNKKTHPKTNHANAPVTCRMLCAISYLQSMQQQRLDEKLILPHSLCLFLSACLYISVLLCQSVVYFSFCLFLVVNTCSRPPSSILTDSEHETISVQVSCQTWCTWGQETLITTNLKQCIQAGGAGCSQVQCTYFSAQERKKQSGQISKILNMGSGCWSSCWVCVCCRLGLPGANLMEAIMANEGVRRGLLPHICCISTNHDHLSAYSEISVYSADAILWQLSVTDTNRVLAAFLSVCLFCYVHWWR